MSWGATAECVFHALWMLNISYKACLHSNVHNAMCNIWQKYLDLLSMGESALWYWAMLVVKSTNFKALAFASFDTHAHIASGTRQITDFFYQSESVHSSTAETTFLIRMFNVHVKRLICAHSKSPWILKFSPWNVLESPWILFWQTPTNPALRPLGNFGNFLYPTLPVSFGRDTKSRWSLLSGAYARGSKISHTGGKCVTCCGLRPCSTWSIMSKRRWSNIV